jgi:hypothetical protein
MVLLYLYTLRKMYVLLCNVIIIYYTTHTVTFTVIKVVAVCNYSKSIPTYVGIYVYTNFELCLHTYKLSLHRTL